MEAGELAFATQRLESVRQLVRPTTRTHLEATALLTVVLIRREEFTVARTLASEVVAGVNNIRSDRRRMQFHKRFLRRIEEEGLLAGMRQHGKRLTIEADEAQARAIELQTLSADELIIHLGSVIPDDARTLMLGFREHVVHALPPSDRKRLPSTTHATAPREIGEKARAALKRVAWGALCDPDDDLHEAWSDNLAVVYDRKWIATAIPSACAKWEIAAGGLAISLIALAFKLGVKVFCRTFAPDSIMIALDDRG